MMIRRSFLPGCLLAAFLWISLPVSAGWWEVSEADASMDLMTAREAALTTLGADPASADAVAAATWWLANLDNLPAPEEILTTAAKEQDPELGFVLTRIESDLASRPPAGALLEAELAGPFGVFSTLDLERAVVPADDELPPPNTLWKDPALPFRVKLRPAGGRHGPPLSMAVDGIYLVAWNLMAENDTNGWLVVEAEGGFNIELDGHRVDRRRNCGLDDPGANWYRLTLAAGAHRLRMELGSTSSPRVRVSLLDQNGFPLRGVSSTDEIGSSWASSKLEWSLPPASAALTDRLETGGGTARELMLAAFLARGRGDRRGELEWLEAAAAADPESPWPALAMARHLFLVHRGGEGGEGSRRIAELLREVAEIPRSQLLERALAMRESRREDAERFLEALMENHGGDVRVLRVWVREAVSRGWAREAEESLALLEAALPGSRSVTGLRLDVLASLERWRERGQLLRALASATPVEARWIGQLASSCLVDEALTATEALVEDVEDPDYDIQLVRLRIERGDFESGADTLERARARWGDLRVLDELDLLIAGDDDEGLGDALEGALARNPSNLQLLTLAWRRGATSFFEPFRVEAREFAAKNRDLEGDSDVTLLLDQAVERIYPDGSSLYYYHGLTRANTPVGTRRASVLQPLPDAYLLKVRILKPDGRVVVPSNLQPGRGAISLDDVDPGDLVEEEYVARVAATGASRHGHLPPYIYRFADPNRAFGLSEYVLLVPPEVDLQVDGNFEGLERSEQKWQGLQMLTWSAERVAPVPTEPFAPPAQDLIPWLNYGFGVTWQDVGDAVRDRLLPILDTSQDLREWSGALLESDDAEAAVQALVDGVVETVEAGSGELDTGTTAGESFSRRRGNRLGIIAAALRESGWEVDLVLTRAWTQRGRRLKVPTLDTFPAAVLRVARAGEEVWIDIREERRGANHINPLFQGADGLVLPLTRPEQPVTLLAELPSFPNPDLVDTIAVRAEISPQGDARLVFRTPLRGAQAEALLEQVSTVPEDRVSMVYRQMAVSIFPGADEVEGSVERVDEGVMMELELTVPGVCETEGEELVCRALVLSRPLVPVLASLPERVHPLILQVPLERQIELELVEPPGWRLVDRSPRRLTADWGSVSESLERNGKSQLSVMRLEIPAQTVEPPNYPGFARFCHAVDELTTRPPRLERIPE
ncbi:MAG: hypothetical protein ACC742_03175 [Thermoanaerobaculales bacterium]